MEPPFRNSGSATLVGCDYLDRENVISSKHQTLPPHHHCPNSNPPPSLFTHFITLHHHHNHYPSPSLSTLTTTLHPHYHSTIITLAIALHPHCLPPPSSPSLSPPPSSPSLALFTVITITLYTHQHNYPHWHSLPSSPSLFTLINTTMD